MKYMASRISPGCMSVSLGGACVDLNFIERFLRQPASEYNESIAFVVLHTFYAFLKEKGLGVMLFVVSMIAYIGNTVITNKVCLPEKTEENNKLEHYLDWHT